MQVPKHCQRQGHGDQPSWGVAIICFTTNFPLVAKNVLYVMYVVCKNFIELLHYYHWWRILPSPEGSEQLSYLNSEIQHGLLNVENVRKHGTTGANLDTLCQLQFSLRLIFFKKIMYFRNDQKNWVRQYRLGGFFIKKITNEPKKGYHEIFFGGPPCPKWPWFGLKFQVQNLTKVLRIWH